MIEREFSNEYGERWFVMIDADRQVGYLRGDELGDEELEIRGNQIQGDLGLSSDEFEQLARIWREATGEELQPTWMNHLEQIVRSLSDRPSFFGAHHPRAK